MAEQARLLVVDDDAEVRRLLGDYLGGQGYQVEAAPTARPCASRWPRSCPIWCCWMWACPARTA